MFLDNFPESGLANSQVLAKLMDLSDGNRFRVFQNEAYGIISSQSAVSDLDGEIVPQPGKPKLIPLEHMMDNDIQRQLDVG